MYKSKYKKASARITRRSKARKIFGASLKVGLPIIVFVGLVFLLRADFLKVQNLAVTGEQAVPQESIKSAVQNLISGNKFLIIPKSDILFINKDKLAAALLVEFPRIEKVDVNKQFFDRGIELSVKERGADFLWCSAFAECYFMNKSGLVFEKILGTGVAQDKIIFTGVLDGNPIMKNFTTPEQMQNYIKFIDTLKNVKLETDSINIESNDRAIAKTNIGDIIFDPQDPDLSLVAQNAILLINEMKSKNSSVHFNYIDIRFGNKMFYKLI